MGYKSYIVKVEQKLHNLVGSKQVPNCTIVIKRVWLGLGRYMHYRALSDTVDYCSTRTGPNASKMNCETVKLYLYHSTATVKAGGRRSPSKWALSSFKPLVPKLVRAPVANIIVDWHAWQTLMFSSLFCGNLNCLNPELLTKTQPMSTPFMV